MIEKKYTIQEIKNMLCDWEDNMNPYKHVQNAAGIGAVQRFLTEVQDSPIQQQVHLTKFSQREGKIFQVDGKKYKLIKNN